MTSRRQRLIGVVIAISILIWLIGAGAGIVPNRSQPGMWTEMAAHSLIVPILLASFFFGRPGGLLVALLSSALSASLAVGQPEILQSPIVRRVLFQVIVFNVVALVTSGLSEREKKATESYRNLFGSVPIANPALVELTGYSLAELDGLSLDTLFPPGEAKTISDANVALLYSGKPISGENTLTPKGRYPHRNLLYLRPRTRRTW